VAAAAAAAAAARAAAAAAATLCFGQCRTLCLGHCRTEISGSSSSSNGKGPMQPVAKDTAVVQPILSTNLKALWLQATALQLACNSTHVTRCWKKTKKTGAVHATQSGLALWALPGLFVGSPCHVGLHKMEQICRSSNYAALAPAATAANKGCISPA